MTKTRFERLLAGLKILANFQVESVDINPVPSGVYLRSCRRRTFTRK